MRTLGSRWILEKMKLLWSQKNRFHHSEMRHAKEGSFGQKLFSDSNFITIFWTPSPICFQNKFTKTNVTFSKVRKVKLLNFVQKILKPQIWQSFGKRQNPWNVFQQKTEVLNTSKITFTQGVMVESEVWRNQAMKLLEEQTAKKIQFHAPK